MRERVLTQVTPFPRLDDAGAGPLLPLQVVLEYLGCQRTYAYLVGISGQAFHFVYDDGPVYEPLRDRTPDDVLSGAVLACGLRGRWHVGLPLEQVLDVICAEVDAGRPVIASGLGFEGRHAYSAIVGYNLRTRTLSGYVGQRGGSEPSSLEIPHEWDGPIPGGAVWGKNPIFTIDPLPLPGHDEAASVPRALRRALWYWKGRPLHYVAGLGAQEYAAVPLEGRSACMGEAAYDLLIADLETREDMGLFSVIWRMDAVLGQLQHHRAAAAAFLEEVAPRAGPAAAPHLTRAAGVYRWMAQVAASLHSRFWDHTAKLHATASDLVEHVARQPGFVFPIGFEGIEGEVAQRLRLLRTPWGPAAITDGPSRRRMAAALATELKALEQEALGHLQAALQHW